VSEVLAAVAGDRGHIFNTGGPIARETSPDALRSAVRMVHDESSRLVATASDRLGQEVVS
jgi:uroporphyrinogen-III decarboxylase